ncbi:MAG: hypothetical protein ACLRSW_00280 [Christensenellaceae bacterium]
MEKSNYNPDAGRRGYRRIFGVSDYLVTGREPQHSVVQGIYGNENSHNG